MNRSLVEILPTLFSDQADDALGHAVIAMRPGWVALRGCVLDADDAAPARVRYALLHPQVGIALLDVVPGQTTPNASDRLKRKLDAVEFNAEFGCIPPILYFCIPVRVLPDVGHLLEYEFGRQPPSPLPRGDGWVTAARAILTAQPLRPTQQLAARGQQQPARRFGGARLLAGFWGVAVLTASGGALFLQYLGPPVQAVTAPVIVEAEAPRAPSVDADPMPSPAAAMSGPTGADLQHTLLANDQAILPVQNRLNGLRPNPGPGMVANAVLTSTTPSGTVAARGVSTAAHRQELAALGEGVDPTPEAAARSADLARAEAALQQLRAEAEATQKRLADMNAQVERAGQQVTAAEQQLAALQHQSEDAQTAGAAAGKQLTDAQAQLRQLEERRSAAEQQLNALQAQADRTQGDRAAVEQQVAAGKAQLAEIAEQQAKMRAAQADRGTKDAADAETRLTEPREPGDPALAPQTAPGEQLNALPPKPSSTGQAAVPAEAAPAVLEQGQSDAPAAVPAAPAAGAASETASFAPALPSARAPDPVSAALADTMIRRADTLLRQGDVSAARLLYDRAASAGSAHAATAMGKTFDATVLAGLGVVGLSPDPALAALWYRRGLSLGDEEARTRLQSLPPAASRAAAARAERP